MLATDVVRIGPRGDRVAGRERYLDLLRRSVPEDYGNEVHRITYAAGGRAAFARVTERLVYPKAAYELEEAYAFEIDERDAVARVEVFWQGPDAVPPGTPAGPSAAD